jgi:hypothetical protein
MENVHVGVQVRRDPVQLFSGDTLEAHWVVEVDTVTRNSGQDFRGPAVQGKRGDRFLYLTWGNVGPNDEFEMFRRAKLMLNRIDPALVKSAVAVGRLTATVDLTGGDGGPRCARVDPPAVSWSIAGK